MEDEFERLLIVVEEEEGFTFNLEEANEATTDISFCLAGHFLTDKSINGHIMKEDGGCLEVMKGVAITEIPQGMHIFLCSIFHCVVQLHDVPTGFVTPMVGKHMENFIREFLEYDSKNNTGGSRPFMRIKVLVGLRNPLKTGKKLIKPKGEWQMIESNCERLGNFCFACDVIGHREKFYPRIQNSLQRKIQTRSSCLQLRFQFS
ncbi:hypothetical protein glysoja_040016 [Glycine soja]|uniref:Zinc knuckle CX2CX4HX4C domain-containing protein n=1 Tax=Glycine soja TaxID=3848 RepID=A0A0B2PAW5_GLYSO|nr:hypothetical protein glysoja_040016 [Glycine soja]